MTVGVETTLFMAVFAMGIFGARFLVSLLFAILRRGAVKQCLRERGCEPIKVRWLPFAWFSPRIRPPRYSVWVMPKAFRVIYSDTNRLIHKAYCWAGYDVGMASAPILSALTSPLNIQWVKDEITGEQPLPEVWVSDETVTKKLKDTSRTEDSADE